MREITHDLTAREKAFRAALLDDSHLVALLGSDTEIWREAPRVKVALPSMIIQITSPGHMGNASYTGEYWPEWQIDVLGDGPDAGRRIHAYLEQYWTIPQAARLVVQSRNQRMTSFMPMSTLGEAGSVMLQATGQEAFLTSRVYRSRIIVAPES